MLWFRTLRCLHIHEINLYNKVVMKKRLDSDLFMASILVKKRKEIKFVEKGASILSMSNVLFRPIPKSE